MRADSCLICALFRRLIMDATGYTLFSTSFVSVADASYSWQPWCLIEWLVFVISLRLPDLVGSLIALPPATFILIKELMVDSCEGCWGLNHRELLDVVERSRVAGVLQSLVDLLLGLLLFKEVVFFRVENAFAKEPCW